MGDELRSLLRLKLSIALELLPRWVKHDFWRPSQPGHDRAKAALVEKLVETVDEGFELTERGDRNYRGWQ